MSKTNTKAATMNNKNQRQFNEQMACNSFAWFANDILKRRGKPKIKGTDFYFLITPDNKEVIKKLVRYFCGQPGELDLDKGVMLQGPCGTGKTELMKCLQLWVDNTPRRFRIADCRDIQKEAIKNGFEALVKYTKNSYNFKNNAHHRDNGSITYCFDDFGAENISKFYGNEVNVMLELIQDRYREFEDTGMKTHGTTNLRDGDLIEEKYDKRVRDRLRQMFNFVELGGKTFRI